MRKNTTLLVLIFINFTTSLIPEAITKMKTALILLSILGMACAFSVSSFLKTYIYFHFYFFMSRRQYVIIKYSFKQMKNFHRRAKLENSEENGVINVSILLQLDYTYSGVFAHYT